MDAYVHMEIEGKNYTAKVVNDTDPINPREDFDHSAVLYCWHRNYNLGDYKENTYSEPADLMADLLFDAGVTDEDGFQLDEDEMEERFPDGQGIRKTLADAGYTIQPLFLYNHSGITMSTSPFSCGWDSGQVGYAVLTPKAFKEHWGREWTGSPEDIEDATKVINGEVEEYDMYLTGDMWGVQIFDAFGEDIDSCWGYFGSDYAEQEARSTLEYWEKQGVKPFKGHSSEFDTLRGYEASVWLIIRDLREKRLDAEGAYSGLLDVAKDMQRERMRIRKLHREVK